MRQLEAAPAYITGIEVLRRLNELVIATADLEGAVAEVPRRSGAAGPGPTDRDLARARRALARCLTRAARDAARF